MLSLPFPDTSQLMATLETSDQPSTAVQLFRVIRREHPLFAFKLLKNGVVYGAHKYLFRHPTMVKKIHSYNMKFDLHDPGISRSLLLVGDREREHRYMLSQAVKPNQTILDLGANIGYYVLMEHQMLGGTGQVIAVEPSPLNYQSLTANITLNNQDSRTICINAAVADQDGQADLYLSQLSNVHSLMQSQVPNPTNQHIKVDTISLSSLNHKHGPIDLIRMDIEGYEQTVLQSLIDLNDSQPFRPSILFEFHPPKYDQVKFNQILSDLYDIGYQAELLATSHQELLQREGLHTIRSIPTDGTIRHIAERIPLKSLLNLYMYSRAVLLTFAKK